MEDFANDPMHPKKRRRRSEVRRPVFARLHVDEKLRGVAAIVSSDLWTDLFSGTTNAREAGVLTFQPYVRWGINCAKDDIEKRRSEISRDAYLAMSLSTSSASDSVWTIVPVRLEAEDESTAAAAIDHPTIRISPTSPAYQAFLNLHRNNEDGRHLNTATRPVEIMALATQPPSLDTVFVTVENNILEKVDEIQDRFGGGFPSLAKNRTSSNKGGSPEGVCKAVDPPEARVTPGDRLTGLVRKGLAKLGIVHSGNIFPLPLPTHPITHVSPTPAIVAACEPVSQGRLSSATKVVVIEADKHQKRALQRLKPRHPVMEESIEDDAEDTSNERFYSAAEDKQSEGASEGAAMAGGNESGDRETSSDHSDDVSDSSLEDIISLSAPGLPPQFSGTLSAVTGATPRPWGTKGTATQTPGSVISNAASTTSRRPSKLFRTEALLQHINAEALHPKPEEDDDEDSFAFVDVNTLAKIGCFSGDWIRLEVVDSPHVHGLSIPGPGGLYDVTDRASDWRPVRIFGLLGFAGSKPRYAVDSSGEERSSFSQMLTPALTPVVLLSPLLLSNLGGASLVKISSFPKLNAREPQSMMSGNKDTVLFRPPLATEVVIQKISTPLTTDPVMQTAIYAGVRQHFESRRRLVRTGDLVGIAVDEEFGRATFSPAKTTEESTVDGELGQKLGRPVLGKPIASDIAWFRVRRLTTQAKPGVPEVAAPDRWGATAFIEPSSTHMQTQAESGIESIPGLARKTWPYWLGMRRPPNRAGRSSVMSAPISRLPHAQPLPLEQRLSDLISAATSPRAISLGLPPLVILLHSTQRRIGKVHTAVSASASAGIHIFTVDANDLVSESTSASGGGDVKSEALLTQRAERALAGGAQFTALLLRHVDVLTADRMIPVLQDIIADARIIIATTIDLEKISDGVRGLFTHELEITAPNEREREWILRNACLDQSLCLDASVELGAVALKTAAFVAGDLVDVVNQARLARSMRLEKYAQEQSVHVSDVLLAGGPYTTNLLAEDFTSAIAHARSTFSDSIGAPKIPSVTWKDVGGLAQQKASIMETISLPLSRPELFAKGMRKRSGILFYGPPGTGKTLLAKAIATEFSLNFFSVKGPELLNMYIGESEANVRRVFQRARDARPCVVFFDELDSVAPKRGNQGDSGGVMDRIVSQLLAELDGMSSGGGPTADGDGTGSGGNAGGVFVIGATNRPDLLDPALLRPGRFDQMLYLGVSTTHEQQVTILDALTRKFILAPEIDLTRVAEKLPLTYTGADLYALCSDAMLKGITRKTNLIDDKVRAASACGGEAISTAYFFDHLAGPEDVEVVVQEEDFAAAQRELVASVR